jgi:hypothetical protein
MSLHTCSICLFPCSSALGSITTLATNPIWTVQTAQSTHAVVVPKTSGESDEAPNGEAKKIRLSAVDAASQILKKDGVKGFWRGIGPALVLVINPVIQVRFGASASFRRERNRALERCLP